MEGSRPLPLDPTLPMLAESLTQSGLICDIHLSDPKQSYRGIRLYHPRQNLQKNVLYLLRPTESDFPFDHTPISAPHRFREKPTIWSVPAILTR